MSVQFGYYIISSVYKPRGIILTFRVSVSIGLTANFNVLDVVNESTSIAAALGHKHTSL